MVADVQERVLLVDDNPIFCNVLAESLRAANFEVITAATGERAFMVLRDWGHPVDWLYSRAVLPGLIDGWILADEYHDTYPDRAVVISAPEAKTSSRQDIVLKQPTPAAVLEALRRLVDSRRQGEAEALTVSEEHQRAA